MHNNITIQKMNIVRISAGLGNQMFQYALYLALKENGADENTAIDITEFQYRKHHQGYELQKVFGVEPRYATKKEIFKIADVDKSFWNCFRRDVLQIKRQTPETIFNQDGELFNSEVFSRKNTYFQGFWQSWKYFDKIEEAIRTQFTFKPPFSEINKACAQAIDGCESVSIHIRRGDYTKRRRWEDIGSICSLDYYNWAIAHIHEQLGDKVHYFIFSDDIEWVKANLPISNATYINWNKDGESYNDLHLMSLCKHNIIANSSFSWWGAFLNQNPDKIVIAPERWYRNTPTPDLIPQGWITLPID